MNGDAFGTHVETQLASALRSGTIGILDNLSAHKNVRRRSTAAKRARFLFLPTYSPDLNPFEMAFAQLKAHLRCIGASTFDQVNIAIGDICDLFTPKECLNFLKHAGYVST